MTSSTRRPFLPVLAVLGALVLGGCGAGDGDASAAAGPSASVSAHSEADVAFAGDMVLHHRQAVEMAQMVLDRGAKAEVKALAARIKAAQDPEITQMTAFLASVGEEVPAEDEGHGGHMGAGAPGMMSHDQMAELEELSGAALDKLFLTLMVEHHEGALSMAADERSKGTSPEMTALAEKIATAQTAEIAEMKALLATYS